MGCRASAAALVEQHDAVAFGIVIAAHGGVAAAARAAMHHDHRFSTRVAGLLEIDFVAVADAEPVPAAGFDGGVERMALHRWHGLRHLT